MLLPLGLTCASRREVGDRASPTPWASWDRQEPAASSMAAYRKIPRRHRPAGVGRSATSTLNASGLISTVAVRPRPVTPRSNAVSRVSRQLRRKTRPAK